MFDYLWYKLKGNKRNSTNATNRNRQNNRRSIGAIRNQARINQDMKNWELLMWARQYYDNDRGMKKRGLSIRSRPYVGKSVYHKGRVLGNLSGRWD